MADQICESHKNHPYIKADKMHALISMKRWFLVLLSFVFCCGNSDVDTKTMDGPLILIHVPTADSSVVTATLTVSVVDQMMIARSFSKTFSQGRLDLLGAAFPMGTRGQATLRVELYGVSSCLLNVGTMQVDLVDDSVSDVTIMTSPIQKCGWRPQLFVTITGRNGARGSVSSVPNGINCTDRGGTCQYAFDEGTKIALTATADASSYFGSWGATCPVTAPTCTISLNSDTHVIADFDTPTNCEQIRSASPTVTDGSRTLFIGADRLKPWDAFCVMSIIPALTYVNLVNSTSNQNFSQFTTGGTATGTSVRTNFSKILIDPATLYIDSNDKRFATSQGSLTYGGTTVVTSMAYASAMGCVSGNSNGVANVDLTGTAFAVQSGALALGGTGATGMTTPSPDGKTKVINLTGGGGCGWNSATGGTNPSKNSGAPLRLVYSP